jgi:hypothetical protein
MSRMVKLIMSRDRTSSRSRSRRRRGRWVVEWRWRYQLNGPWRQLCYRRQWLAGGWLAVAPQLEFSYASRADCIRAMRYLRGRCVVPLRVRRCGREHIL